MGFRVRLTAVPLGNDALHLNLFGPHFGLPRLLITEPYLVFFIVILYFGRGENTGVTVILFLPIVTWQILPSALVQPFHLFNINPSLG
jgi:hypothetical protein